MNFAILDVVLLDKTLRLFSVLPYIIIFFHLSFLHLYFIAPFCQFCQEVGRGGNAVTERGLAFFLATNLFLALMQGKRAQVMGHLLCASDGDIANWIMLVVAPHAKTITEIGRDVYLPVGNKGFWHKGKTQSPVEGKTLNGFLMLTSLLISQDIPAALICFQAIRMHDGIVWFLVGKLLINDA